MAHSLTSGMVTQTTAKSLMPILLWELDTPGGNVYFWSGYGNLPWDSKTWVGAGNMVNMTQISETALVQANGLSLTLSGIPAAAISLALSSVKRFQPAKVWLGALDSSMAVVADPFLIFNGRTDSVVINDAAATAAITVNCENRLILMKIARERRYTDHDQRIERPLDGGFKFVDFVINRTIPWGASGAAATAPAASAQSQAQSNAANLGRRFFG